MIDAEVFEYMKILRRFMIVQKELTRVNDIQKHWCPELSDLMKHAMEAQEEYWKLHEEYNQLTARLDEIEYHQEINNVDKR
jgi:hypothetical protein